MHWGDLGAAIRERRAALGLTQSQVRERGGPAVETVRALENNRATSLSSRKRRELERALSWEEGSIDSILAGSHPIPRFPVAPDSTEQFALARQTLSFMRIVALTADRMEVDAFKALDAELARAARDSERSIARVMPTLGDDERGEAIKLLNELRGE